MIKINGKEVQEQGKSILEYLKENDYNITRIAVEKNGEIVPKRNYKDAILSDGDVIEIVSFVGGG